MTSGVREAAPGSRDGAGTGAGGGAGGGAEAEAAKVHLHLPAVELLDAMGFVRVLEASAAGGRVRAEFDAQPRFCHTDGTIVQGGFVTAWMDFAMAQATLLRLGPGSRMASLELKVSFLQRVGPGRVVAEGRVQRLGRRVAFLEGSLFDAQGALLATATSTGMVLGG